jgi:hydrogenase expression/formation protein HypD
MRHQDEYRRADVLRALAAAITREALPGRRYHLMEFCGGHTHAIFRYGLHDLLPPAVRMVHGPGCPVCVLPIGRLDGAIRLARTPGVTLCSYGDMLRVPGSNRTSLLAAKAGGADVRMVYSILDALALARAEPSREVVFFAIGFETTTPPTAVALREARREGLRNFTVYSNHVLTPAAIQNILESPEVRALGTVPLDGFVGPGHVSTVIGTRPYEYFAEEYRRPVVVAGFEPADLLHAILRLVRQINEGRHEVENAFGRGVTREGNRAAQALVAEVFELRRAFEWRGLGLVPYSGLRIKADYAEFDAERRFGLETAPVPDHRACACGAVLRGVFRPTDCKLYGKVCTPENPMGSCMVSPEGACAAYFQYRVKPGAEPCASSS